MRAICAYRFGARLFLFRCPETMQIIETPVFTRRVAELLSDDEYRRLQAALLAQPDLGAVIMRWSAIYGSKGRDMRDELFEELLESARQAGAIMRGEMEASRVFACEDVDVAALRDRFKLSQPKFAAMLGISVGTLRNWEQKRRRPEGPARVLLRVATLNPEAVLAAAGIAPAGQRR